MTWNCPLCLQNYTGALPLTYLFSFLLLTGRYLLPNPVAGQVWPASAETSNLVRMRSQALGQSAPSLTASLVSVLRVFRVALAIVSLRSVPLLQANGLGQWSYLPLCVPVPSWPPPNVEYFYLVPCLPPPRSENVSSL